MCVFLVRAGWGAPVCWPGMGSGGRSLAGSSGAWDPAPFTDTADDPANLSRSLFLISPGPPGTLQTPGASPACADFRYPTSLGLGDPQARCSWLSASAASQACSQPCPEPPGALPGPSWHARWNTCPPPPAPGVQSSAAPPASLTHSMFSRTTVTLPFSTRDTSPRKPHTPDSGRKTLVWASS